MIAVLGLLVLAVAVLAAVGGVAANTGGGHPLGSDFEVAGLHLSGLSVGELFLCGIVVGAAAMLGLSMLLGTFSRRLASRGARRDLEAARRQTQSLLLDRERLTQQLADQQPAVQQPADRPPAQEQHEVARDDVPAPADAGGGEDRGGTLEPADSLVHADATARTRAVQSPGAGHPAGPAGLLPQSAQRSGGRS